MACDRWCCRRGTSITSSCCQSGCEAAVARALAARSRCGGRSGDWASIFSTRPRDWADDAMKAKKGHASWHF